MADVFNYMAKTLAERDRLLLQANLDLEKQNASLANQQQELMGQQQELMAQQQELIAQQDALLKLNGELETAAKQLEKSENIVYTLALAVEAKDNYIKGHSERVAEYAGRIANAMQLTKEERGVISDAAILHDLGKMGISDAILNKPGALSPEEYKFIKQHPIIGEKICQPLSSAEGLLPIIRHHHERYDGKGYPDGLAGMEIPLGARILAIADAFDAMTSDRPYRTGMPFTKAISILIEGAGSQWDPSVVDRFVEVMNENEPLHKDGKMC